MSNPTELPDLEAAAQMLEQQHTWLTNVSAANLVRSMARRAQPGMQADKICIASDVLTLIIATTTDPETAKLAADNTHHFSRAQPESEAPQAEPQRGTVTCDRCDGDGSVRSGVAGSGFLRCAECDGDGVVRITVPAAQHAESGAPDEELRAALLELTATQRKLIDAYAELAVYQLAAQSQGAQAQVGVTEAMVKAAQEAALESGEIFADELPMKEVLNAALRAQQAAAPGALDLLNAEELAALHRFQETCEDSEGYDVGKDMMKRLAAIGVIESKGFNRYQFTEFGDYVVENRAPSAPGTPEAPKGSIGDLTEFHILLDWYDNEASYGSINEGRNKLTEYIDKWADRRAAQLDGGQGEGA